MKCNLNNINLSHRVCRLILAGFMVSILSACGLFLSDDSRNRPIKLTKYIPVVHFSTVWNANIGSGSGTGFTPVIVNDAVYAATPNGWLGKYDLQAGLQLWHIDTNTRLSAGVGSDGTTTVVAALDGKIIAYDDTGKEKWSNNATSNVGIPPIVGYNIVVVRSSDYRIQAFDVSSGKCLWHLQCPNPALALQVPSQLFMAEGLVIVGLPGGKLLALDTTTGSVQWEGMVTSPQGASDIDRLTDVVGTPRLVGSLLCAVAYQGHIACFDVNHGGQLLWSKKFSSSAGTDLNSQFIFATDSRSIVSAFALRNGASIWQQSILLNRTLTAPAIFGSGVAVGDYEGYIHLLSINNGKLLGRVAIGGGAIASPLTSTMYGILVQTGNGNLVMLNVQY